MSANEVARIDPQARSVFLTDGTRLGFAQARRLGIDVEALQATGK
jgi:hypothetical protein